MTGVSYTPQPHERAYYEGLFQAADVQRSSNIGGAQAVQFFKRSALPMAVLKNIWTVADQPSTSSLDRAKFAVAIRLIQLTQNGQKGQGPTLAVAEGVNLRPVFFEGVSGVAIAMPPANGQQPPPQQQQRQAPPTPQQQQRPVYQQQAQAPPTPQQQQMRAPPTPTSQRSSIQQQPPTQQLSAPPTPVRQGIPPPTTGPSMALVAHDPYSMTPQERARYEELFPQYANPDGFIYGKEAVELFMRSGVDQVALREVWNMVDRPVDNRLDRLEFAIAMHLIVCISKKNLPAPTGTLPNSLKALKAAQSQPATPSMPQRPPVQAQPTMVAQQGPPRMPSPPPAQQQMGMGMGGMPSPDGQRPSIPPPGATTMQPSHSFDQQQQQQPPMSPGGPPPVVAAGGMTISDAFEGLSTTSGDVHQSTLPSYVPEPPPSRHNYSSTPAVIEEPAPAPAQAPFRSPAPAPVAPPSTKSLASNYDMGTANEELMKLKDLLQKLQAENIALKAQLGSMSDEEKDVQKELGVTITEVGKLSTELHSLRAEVLASKTRLLEASAKLKASKEQKGVLNDLISEAGDTKTAIEEVHSSLENASEAAHHIEKQKQSAVRKSDVFESNLFGYSNGTPAPAVQPSMSYESMENATPFGGAAASVDSGEHSLYSQPSSQPAPAMVANFPLIETPSSEEEQAGGVSHPKAPDLFSNEYNQPPPMQHEPAQPPAQTEHPPPTAQKTQSLERPNKIGHQPRQSSLGFNPAFIMGGAAESLADADGATSPASRGYTNSSGYGYDDEESYKNVEEMKKKAESASETARDAEAAHRRLVSEADELRQDADKAEATARSFKAASEEKKKGRFGGGGNKKKLVRESEKAAHDAQDIRKRFLIVQGQANDAQAVAMETKREADRLRDEAEKSELDMAAAASMRDQQKSDQEAQQKAQAPPSAPSSNGYPPQQGQPMSYGYGQPPGSPQGYGYGQPPAMTPADGGYGQQPPMTQYNTMAPPSMDGGFAAGVMGGGGDNAFDLPSPSQFGQPQPAGEAYNNPFAS